MNLVRKLIISRIHPVKFTETEIAIIEFLKTELQFITDISYFNMRDKWMKEYVIYHHLHERFFLSHKNIEQLIKIVIKIKNEINKKNIS